LASQQRGRNAVDPAAAAVLASDVRELQEDARLLRELRLQKDKRYQDEIEFLRRSLREQQESHALDPNGVGASTPPGPSDPVADVSSSATLNTANTGDYLSSLVGSSGGTAPNPPKKTSYTGFGTRPTKTPETSGTSYLSALNNGFLATSAPLVPATVPASTSAAVPSASSASASGSDSYLTALGGQVPGNAKPTSYSPFSSKPLAPETGGGGYLGALNSSAGNKASSTQKSTSAASARTAPLSSPAATTVSATAGDYMDFLGGSSSKSKPASYSPFNSKPRVPETGSDGYLSALNSGSRSKAPSAVAAAKAAPTSTAGLSSTDTASTADYMGSLSGSGKSSKPASYSGFNTKHRAPENWMSDGYLGALNGGIGISSSGARPPPSTHAAPRPSTAVAQPPPASYSGFNVKHRAVESRESC